MASTIYNTFFLDALLAQVDWDTHDLRCALVDNTYTPDIDDTQWTSGKEPFDSEVVGSNYTAGGIQLTNATVNIDDTNDEVEMDADDVTWQTSTITAKYAVIFNSSHAAKDLICVFEFTEDKSSANGDFTVQWNVEGLINLQQS